VRERLQAACEGLDPDSVPLPEVIGLFDTLVAVEHLAAGAQLRLLRRLDEAHLDFGPGVRSTEEEIARRKGTSVRDTQESMAASKRLRDQAGTDDALRKGQLSDEQARTISDAAGDDAAAERDLLATAKRRDQGLRDLKRKAAETKARREPDPAARRDAIRKSRHCRSWTGADGAWNLSMRHLPEVGAEIERLLAPFTQTAFDAARTAGVHEPHEAYRADGLVAMAKASAQQSGCERPKGASAAETKLFVHIDLDTLLRGRLGDGGSICHLDGIGPVDVAWVRSVLGEAFVIALLEDRQGVRDVVHLGRKVTAHQRSALEARGHRCEVPGCSATHGLQIDHITGWTLTHTTQLDDLMWLCRHHHDHKTHRGATITGPPGNRTWHPPPPKTQAKARANGNRSPMPSEAPAESGTPAPQPDLFAGAHA
jgi:hypothetical protein